MNDLPNAPTDDLLPAIAADALVQAERLIELDGPRAEAWGSDLAALALEASEDGVVRLVAALAEASGPAAAAALWALSAVTEVVDLGDSALKPAPTWASSLGTSRCVEAMILRERRWESVAFRFVDSAEDAHVIVVDLVPPAVGGGDETVGEVNLGAVDLLDVLQEEDAGIVVVETALEVAAGRVARALANTVEPRDSAVANGRVLVVRLQAMVESVPAAPVAVEASIPEIPVRDPDDDAYARDMLWRAVGDVAEPGAAALAQAAAVLREAAAHDDPIAHWLAASVGPVDLDDTDTDVVLAAVAATVSPASLLPLDHDARTAVLDLEWADWLGAVIELVRRGPGTPVDPEALVDHINRNPEVTSTIPKKDRPRVGWAFGAVTDLWEPIGLADAGGITTFGCAVLPRALDRAWQA